VKRFRCPYCHAKPRVEFSVFYRGKQLCNECTLEYAAIFDGFKSKRNKSVKVSEEADQKELFDEEK